MSFYFTLSMTDRFSLLHIKKPNVLRKKTFKIYAQEIRIPIQIIISWTLLA